MITIKAHLDHLAIVSWRVEAARLAAMLPVPLVPQTIDPEKRWGLVSMTLMQDSMAGATFSQLNERAYVMLPDGTGKGAFFWRSHAATLQALLVRALLGVPEFVADVSLTVTSDVYRFRLDGKTVAKLDLRRVGERPSRPVELRRAIRVSANPMIGYTLNWGRLCATFVRHNRIQPRRVRVVGADPSFMIPSIAIEKDRTPFLALYQRRTPFWIDLPPRPIAGGGYGFHRLAGARSIARSR